MLACASVGNFVWVDEYMDHNPQTTQGYVIGPGDLLSIKVFEQESMSGKQRVRDDGKITMQFLNEVDASGYEPQKLAEILQVKLKSFINKPLVTISVEEVKPLSITVLGEVVRPGLLQVEPGAGVLQAIAQAGGPTVYARHDRVFVVRQKPTLTRIRFDYQALLRATGKAASFRLKSGDAIILD